MPYTNVTLDNGQQVTVLLENPKGVSGHNKPQAVSNNSISAFEQCIDVCVSELEHVKM